VNIRWTRFVIKNLRTDQVVLNSIMTLTSHN